MANVGNLFVNISGNTKGLTKALGNAKRSIRGFGKEASGMLGMGKGSEQALNVYRALSTKMAGQMAEGDLKGARQTKRMRELYRPQAEQFQRYTQAQARLATSATLGVLGLTVAGVAMMGRKSLQQIQTSKEGVAQFRYLGPQGARVIQAEVGLLMDQIKSARRGDISEAEAQKAEAARMGFQKATESGATALSINVDTFFERMGYAFTAGLSAFVNDPVGMFTSPIDTMIKEEAMQARNGTLGTQGSSQP